MTFKELYFCNDRWSGDTILAVDIIPDDWNTSTLTRMYMSIYDIMRKYGDSAVDSFKNDRIILREV